MTSRKFDLKYKSFEDWCATHAESLPGVNAETADERSLANWLKNKLTSCRSGKLPDNQLAKLKKIPGLSNFPDVSQECRKRVAEFDGVCERVDKLFTTHQGMSSSNKKSLSPEEMSMAVWLKNKLYFYRRGKLPDDQMVKLANIHWFRKASLEARTESPLPIKSSKNLRGEKQKHFAAEVLLNLNNNLSNAAERLSKRRDFRYKSFEDWCASHNGTLPKQRGETKEERSLAIWLKNKLYKHRNGKLPDEQLVKLRDIPGLTDVLHVSPRSEMLDQKFDLTCKRFKEWCDIHHGTLPKRSGETKEEQTLAIWLSKKLQNYRRRKLPDEQIAKIKRIPCLSNFPNVSGASKILAQKFDCTYNRLEEWCATHAGTLPKQNGPTEAERALAKWLKNKLYRYRCGKLPDEQVVDLQKLPQFLERSSSRSEKFQLACDRFREWCAAHDGALPKQKGTTELERSMAIWLKKKLQDYKRGKLRDDENLVKLRTIPCLSEFPHISAKCQTSAQNFEGTYKSIEDWCAAHDGMLPKRKASTKEERSLAEWLSRKLQKYRHGKLPDEQLAKLRKSALFGETFGVTQ